LQKEQEAQQHNAEPDHNDRSRSPKNTTGIELRRDPTPAENGRPSTPPKASATNSNHSSPKHPTRTNSSSGKLVVGPHHDADAKSLDDDNASPSRERSATRRVARSGSITETTVDLNGMKKMVLDTNSSSDDDKSPTKPWQGYGSQIREEDEESQKNEGNSTEGDASKTGSGSGNGTVQSKKKKNKKNKKKGKH
jgi:metal transporter CNNM